MASCEINYIFVSIYHVERNRGMSDIVESAEALRTGDLEKKLERVLAGFAIIGYSPLRMFEACN